MVGKYLQYKMHTQIQLYLGCLWPLRSRKLHVDTPFEGFSNFQKLPALCCTSQPNQLLVMLVQNVLLWGTFLCKLSPQYEMLHLFNVWNVLNWISYFEWAFWALLMNCDLDRIFTQEACSPTPDLWGHSSCRLKIIDFAGKPPGIFLKRKLRKYLPATANLLVVANVTRET